MDNLSTANSTDLSSQIGALELGDYLEGYGDGVLEAAWHLAPTTSPQTGCRTHVLCVDDGALEASAENMAIGPSGSINCLPPTALCR
jgi:hypothetical protein